MNHPPEHQPGQPELRHTGAVHGQPSRQPPPSWPMQSGSTPVTHQQSVAAHPTSSYGGFGAFSQVAPPPSGRSKRTRWLIAGSGLALAVALGVLVAWLIGWIQFGDVLDKASVETGVVKVLNEHYGEADVTRADCPSGESVKPGNTFDCSVEISGKERTVGIKVINEKPEFEVGKPE